MIRKATEEDIPRIVEMGAKFHAMSPWKNVPFDPAALSGFIAKLIAGGVVLISDKGMLGGVLNPLYFNPSVVMAAELFWWGDAALKPAFEAWAQENGAQGVQFGALWDQRRERMLQRYAADGFEPVEIGFAKRF